ncbi:LysM peptidoglycan-binding domain-containing protein [Streptomyces sp. FL07-04A]|uniref:LysM peptidoglycan-binding domain-containing protein n=1 Tax=Streptomyces sp. FL07-04A TaxID=3028658 RepID=UPI0029AFEB4D|nr:LysM peptidoglycan-binding domain-containing protein [Streptomyces sp. FL07-04A]MDX3579222.1 LysM peptidoglycan-binding domain-containing protein [Streptomyces sp. FL07-04A]
MPSTSSLSATARRLAGALKAVLSLVVLAAAVVGLPLLLTWVTPLLWASTRDDLSHLLDRQDTGAAFLLLLVAVGWIGWAQFSCCAVCELIAQLRGRTWRVPRGMGVSQRAAALLIGSILVLLPASSALASDAQASPAASGVRVPGPSAGAPLAGEADRAATSRAPTARASYTVREVRPAESLWGIAERELGDGERWREIAALNEGRVMPDGEVFQASSFLRASWQLELPVVGADGVRTQLESGPAALGGGGGHAVTVRSGDYLSKIAEEELGDGDQWPALFEANQGRPQPHGLPSITDADVIYAGQQIMVPASPSEQQSSSPKGGDGGSGAAGSQESAPPAPQVPQDDDTSGDGQGSAPGQATGPTPKSSAPSVSSSRTAAQPSQEHSAPGAASATPQPSAGASSSSVSPPGPGPGAASEAGDTSSPGATASETPASAPGDGPLVLRSVLGAGALLAAAVTGALALRRTLQRRRRKPGETIAIAPEASPAEAKLAAAAAPGGAVRLDAGLRTMAYQTTRQAGSMPALRAARISARRVEVLPEDLVQAPQAPFVCGQGGWWVLESGAVVLDEEAVREAPAPYPGLVTVGSSEAGDLVLLNLAGVSAVLLDGNPVHIAEVCTSLALELGMSPWASEVEVVTVGFGEELPQLLPTARIAHLQQAAHALRDLSERLLEAHQMPETRRQPYVLLCASSLDPDTAWEFADVIDKAGTIPVTLVAPAGTAAAHFPEAQILNASLSTPQHLDSIGTEITLQRLEHAAYLQITTALRVSAQPAHAAEGPWRDVPAEPDDMARSEQAERPESLVPTASAGTSTVTRPADASGEIFPALLAASTEPTGLPVLLATAPAAQAKERQDPGTETSVSQGAEGSEPTPGGEHAPAVSTAQEGAHECAAHDPHTPQIRVLGPVEVTGVDSTGHGPRMAQLAALLYFRPGRGADAVCGDMDPVSPWGLSTLNARMQGLRRCLGSDPDGHPYVPRRTSGEDPYRLSPAVQCDWSCFLQLVKRALPLGPAGLPELEKALTLVRGKPFGGSAPPWAEPHQQEMITRIIDVAHTVATHRTATGAHHDLSAARAAVTIGLTVDDTAELLYRDWFRIEHASGNRQGLHTAITRVQQVNRALDCSLETETEQLIATLLHPGNRP